MENRKGIQTVAKKELFVKALFDYDANLDSGLPSKGLSFRYGDIIHVTNATDFEWWQARILISHPALDRGLNGFDENGSDFGIIPSRARVERKERKRINQVKFHNGQEIRSIVEFNEAVPPNETTTFYRQNQNGRTKKSKNKSKLRLTRRFPFMKSVENVSNIESTQSRCESIPETASLDTGSAWQCDAGSDAQMEWILSYEAVKKTSLDYVRPIVILGPMKDRIMEDLIQDHSDRFGVCIPHTTRPPREGEIDGAVGSYFFIDKEEMTRQKELGHFFEVGIHNDNLYGTSIHSVRKVSDEGLHCVLDVRGDAIRELHKKGIYPIAIYIKPRVSNRTRASILEDQIAWLMEMNKRLTPAICKKTLEDAEKTEAEFADCFTAAVTGDSIDELYQSVLNVIDIHGDGSCWLPSGDKL